MIVNAPQRVINFTKKGNETMAKKQILGKDDFMNLLITELKYQDPLNPIENKEFAAQLAQFTSLEQLTNINKNLKDLKEAQSLIYNRALLDFIGKKVIFEDNHIGVKEGNAQKVDYVLESPAQNIIVKILNGNGRVLRKIELGPKPSGKYTFLWDGKDSLGKRVPDGEYRIEIIAKDNDGEVFSPKTYISGKVESIEYRSGKPYLVVNGILEDPKNIISIGIGG